MSEQYDVASQVKAVNHLLEMGEPTNISVDTFSGYTGYKPQFIIDAMNEVFGIGAWGFEEISSEIVTTQTDKATATLAITQVKVWLKAIAFHPAAWGQARVTKGDLGDARKGAQTDAIKKALSYFSIGNRAYQGLLSKDGNTSAQAPTLGQIKQKVKSLRLVNNPDEWRAFKIAALSKDVDDKQLTPAHLMKLNEKARAA